MVENFLERFNLKPNLSFNELLCTVTDWVFIDRCQLSWFATPTHPPIELHQRLRIKPKPISLTAFINIIPIQSFFQDMQPC